jgi:DNA-binding IclR family transcriptional regulator
MRHEEASMPTSETQSLHRAIAILDCFRISQPELGVREIARQLDLHPSTVGRMLTTMTSLGILTQDMENHRYRMGSKVLKWGAVYMNNLDLRAEALPHMQDLYKITQETVSLYLLDGNERVCIERLESPQTVRMVARVGERMPLYAGASGKVLLAFLRPEQRDAILQDVQLQRLTSKTIVNVDALREEIALIKKRGYAVSQGERVEGASSVAAPIFDENSRVLAAINISGPTTRFTKQKLQKYATLLLGATSGLSAAMGYSIPTKSS